MQMVRALSSITNICIALYVQYPSNATSEKNLTVSLGPNGPVDNVFTSTGKIAANETVPQGPYFVHKYTGKVYQAYRLYPDTSQAFLQVSLHLTCMYIAYKLTSRAVFLPRSRWRAPQPPCRNRFGWRLDCCRAVSLILHPLQVQASGRCAHCSQGPLRPQGYEDKRRQPCLV